MSTSIIEEFHLGHVLCVGDIMLDRFIGGSVRRISPESPVPVLLIDNDDVRVGGGANVARNIGSLGGRCTLIGVVGDDEAGLMLASAVRAIDGITPDLAIETGRPTTEKTRFITNGQHMLRADRETSRTISVATEDAILARVAAQIEAHAVLVLSDYAKGVLTDRVISEAIAIARSRGRPVVVDPKSARLDRYAGATVLTPNTKEIALAVGVEPLTDETAIGAGMAALEMAKVDAILLTRAERGMTLLSVEHGPSHIRATAREVFDVVGAGDTVVATLALCMAVGLPLTEAAVVANAAAGVVVGKRGTAVVLPSELRRAVSAAPHEAYAASDKVLSAKAALEQIAAWKQQGHKVGFTNGCFDILHAGHIRLIDYSRAHCGRLIIGLNSDASVKRLKGPQRPINSAEDRALLLASLSNVDAVVVFEEDTPRDLIVHLLPDVLVKGADYTVDQIAGAQEVIAAGGEVLLCELVPGRSTTNILAKGRTNA